MRGSRYAGAGLPFAEETVLQTVKYLLNLYHSSPPQRRGQGWWFALPRSSAGAIKMRRRLLLSPSARSTDLFFPIIEGKTTFVSSAAGRPGSWGTAPSVFWFLLYAQKERHGGEPYRLCTLHNQCDADRRDETLFRQPLSHGYAVPAPLTQGCLSGGTPPPTPLTQGRLWAGILSKEK